VVKKVKDLNFEDLWNKSRNENLEETERFWDLRAEEFNNMVQGGEEKEQLMKYLISKTKLDKEHEVLDIGCGPGKYLLEFAKIVKETVGIDISPKMISYARDNVKKQHLNNVNLKVAPWQTLNIDRCQWNKKFNLVFASMSPAINSKESLMKLMEVSKQYCFISGFVYRRDNIRDSLMEIIFGEDYEKPSQKNIYCAFNILWNMAFYPEITYRDAVWNKKIPIDQAIDTYTFMICKNNGNQQLIKDKVTSYLTQISNDGQVEEHIEAKIAWMLWEV